jgi:SAM-dependent methyltransferase
VVDGLPIFAEAEEYWGEVPQDLMQRLVARGRVAGWRQAAADLLSCEHPMVASYIDDPCRADWRFLLPDTSGWVALDVGAGWGAITMPLAEACASVVALENVRERAQFIQLRARETANVRVLCADVMAPPLAEESFDLVVMNGVVEWLGLSDTTRDPRAVQVSVLDSMRRLLRPGGYLYVGIENRFGYPFWAGAVDHSGVPFTSLLPRRVADWYRAVRRRMGRRGWWRTGSSTPRYRTYTYTARGYRKLIAEAGYNACQVFISVPSYNWPHAMVPVESQRLIGFYASHLAMSSSPYQRLVMVVEQVLGALRLQAMLGRSFSILARR